MQKFQNDSELFGRTIRVNIAAPQRIKEGSTRPVWSEDSWLQKHAGETLNVDKNGEEDASKDKTETGSVSKNMLITITYHFYFFILKAGKQADGPPDGKRAL